MKCSLGLFDIVWLKLMPRAAWRAGKISRSLKQ
jgi:hypothetical protein